MNDCALTALFDRIAAHAGMKKAAVAVAHRILLLAYSIIRDGRVIGRRVAMGSLCTATYGRRLYPIRSNVITK